MIGWIQEKMCRDSLLSTYHRCGCFWREGVCMQIYINLAISLYSKTAQYSLQLRFVVRSDYLQPFTMDFAWRLIVIHCKTLEWTVIILCLTINYIKKKHLMLVPLLGVGGNNKWKEASSAHFCTTAFLNLFLFFSCKLTILLNITSVTYIQLMWNSLFSVHWLLTIIWYTVPKSK